MKKENFFKKYWLVMLCGLVIGAAAVVLTAWASVLPASCVILPVL